MPEILLSLYRASRAKTPLFLFDAAALIIFSKTKGDLFFAVHKTWAHPTDAEPDSFFLIHDPILPAVHCFRNYL
ncbi:MAG: hypothetical protein NTZ37_06330 [Methanoregula sp.]|nr:hypothetical protein [Methanoregula sp.]